MTKFDKRVSDFKSRILEEPEFCEELFQLATTRLLAFKYSYYVLSKTIVKDDTYDAEEMSWRVMGAALGKIHADTTSPCIDWDQNHPLAEAGIVLCLSFKPH